ncbi:hypothetical protein [Actinomadura decatromicini]|uniref:Uncharacterized protein n=1 Tax=Actinomadura decatromicini TaxID=2604572 RepID=A0A5D3FAZ3_9ACTN|nr:hypothetical protein [Actinomadura decatromicini]TYK45108.1 hypothetical protein FXF68_30975 [Actinomadura decatromicini]
MRDLGADPPFETTGDGFSLAAGSKMVTPAEFPTPSPLELVMPVVAEALRLAAADDGSLLDFNVRVFYDAHVTRAMEREPDDPPLRYDAFTFMTLMDAFHWLEAKGYLAHRGNGDSYDYWLASPT